MPNIWADTKDFRENIFLKQTGVSPKLPLIPQPLPDETLYSWIGRYHRRTCGTSIADTLQRLFGISNRRLHVSGVFKRGDTAIRHLTEVCGSTVERFYAEFTLWYYQAAFNAVPYTGPESLVPGSVLLHDIASLSGPRQKSPDRRGKIISREQVGLRLCPACVKEDHQIFGVPYWHRCHQMPSVHACHIHGSLLLDQCPNCGAGFLQDGRLLGPKRLCTICGSLLTKSNITHDPGLTNAYVRFAQLSAGPLVHRYVPFSLPLLSLFYDSCAKKDLLGKQQISLSAHISKLVQSRWGNVFLQEQLGEAGVDRKIRSWINALLSGRLQSPIRHIILIGAIADDYSEFHERYLDFVAELECRSEVPLDQIARGKEKVIHPRKPLGINEARKQLTSTLKKNPGLTRTELARSNKRLSMALLTRDREWYCQQLPTKTKRRDGTFAEPGRVSSIESDRQLLESMLVQHPTLNARALYEIQTPLYRRMLLRDREWLEEKLRPDEGKGGSNENDQSMESSQLVTRIADAAELIKNLPGRPRKVTTGNLMEALNVNRWTLLDKSAKSVKEAMAKALESPEGYYRRLCDWAIRQLKANNEAVTASRITKLIGVTPKLAIRSILKLAIAEAGEEYPRRKVDGWQ